MGDHSLSRDHNYGIDILRIWMCFEVILNHFWSDDWASGHLPRAVALFFGEFLSVAVPAFIFLSFMLCAPSFDRCNLSISFLRSRLKRIVIPILVWGIILFVAIDTVRYILAGVVELTLSDLLMQLLFGHVYNTPMWYMNVLLAQTLTVVLINRFVPRRLLVVVYELLSGAAFVFSLSGVNYICFGGLPDDVKYTLGRYFETLPFVGVANIFYYSGWRMPVSNRLRWWLCAGMGLVVLLLSVLMSGRPCEGFGYSSGYIYLATVPLVLMMMMLPVDGLPSWLLGMMRRVAHYTLGVYCIHMYVGERCNDVLRHLGMGENTFWGCVAIFVLSYVVVRIIGLLPWRWVKEAVS